MQHLNNSIIFVHPTNFLDVPLYNAHLVKLSWVVLFNSLPQKMALHILQPLLLAHSPLRSHQEVEVADVRAVCEQLVYEHAAEVTSSTGDEYILSWKCRLGFFCE